ncbi:NhaP-type Na+/H+ or K+/H+ antiporter [Catalinimonas alkaloidigena]|uniref:cation:proton antiporter n=1 Tax=Catalinimonas alkaloidigena TaxID=1075417 RepID=UPI0024055F30|nr:cation:proton antiporter [Catalinimonas alkaloidigena]MDF9798828.1 NhaP-type Na+/H+ or K+/H+ antiporter [Catalinimonas alkaloidigena]
MESYIISITVIGTAALGMTWIPSLTKKLNISYSIIFLLFGVIIYSVIDNLPWPNPYREQDYTVHLTELIVIVALMGTGLKIDHPFSFKEWKIPFRLVTITMLFCIASMVVLGVWGLGFDLASAVLLGAVLAPTDPVLASDVQVGPPNEGENDVVRFSLTAEAGLNDGMAFPFTWLAIILAIVSQTGEPWLGEWLWRDVLYRLFAGVGLGFLLARLITYLFFHLPDKYKMLHVRDGLVAVSATLFIYGVTELAHGYGFMAVFVAAVTIRNYEIKHEYHQTLHSFTDQIERILLAVLLTLFGGSLVAGILNNLSWNMALIGLGFVLIIRPLGGLIGMLGIPIKMREKIAIGFFGIKGIGSFFYLAFALNETDFVHQGELWSMTAFIVLISILLHGLTASITMKKLKLRYITEQESEKQKEHKSKKEFYS